MIDGVKIKKLKVFGDDRGYLFETLRKDDELYDDDFAQATVSVLYPNAIKAFHRHHKQTDYVSCVKGNIKLVLVQEKNGEKIIETYYLGERNPILIKIPTNIWHGYTSVGNKEAILVYYTNQTFDPTDEERIKFDAFGDVWSIKHK